jgi:hypothetical protein
VRLTQSWGFAHGADRAALHEFHHSPVVGPGVNLRAHLRGDAGRARGFGDDARFVDVAGERFLARDMLLALQGGQSEGLEAARGNPLFGFEVDQAAE